MQRRVKMRTWQWLLLMVSGLALIWSLMPLLADGIFGIGAAVPAAVALGGILWALFSPLSRIRRKGWRRAMMIALSVLAAVITVVGGLCTIRMIRSAATPPTPGATVVVLGSKIHGDRPSRMLRNRLDLAGDYLLNNPEAKCVVSGGLGEGETYTEAYVMKRYLVEQRGIAPERIAQEDESTNTRENLLFSLEVIRGQGWNTDVVIATQIFHQYRAGRMARDAGATAVGATACLTPFHLMLNYWVRECAAICRMWLFGF